MIILFSLTKSHPVIFDSLIEHGCEPELSLLTDVGAADNQPDPVRLVHGDTHVGLYLGHRLSQNQTSLVIVTSESDKN